MKTTYSFPTDVSRIKEDILLSRLAVPGMETSPEEGRAVGGRARGGADLGLCTEGVRGSERAGRHVFRASGSVSAASGPAGENWPEEPKRGEAGAGPRAGGDAVNRASSAEQPGTAASRHRGIAFR